MNLFNREMSRYELARRCGSLSQCFGVQAFVLEDGVERGVRCLEFRTGSGFRFTVLVDRAFDIGAAEFRGTPIGWHSPTGFRHPGLHEYNDEHGLSWLRSFSGLLVTAGLDHTLFMASDTASQYSYTPRQRVDHTLHGRISNIPGSLHGYGEQWNGDQCTLWCEGTVVQATVFGENLHLIRRIEATVGESRLRIRDRVVNRGFSRTPHMLLYHINLGWPLLDEGSEYLAPVVDTVWASHADRLKAQGVGVRTQSAPAPGFHEQVFEHRLQADEQGKIVSALVNPNYEGGRGIGFAIEVNRNEFPYQFQWQAYHDGLYAMALEPSTNHVLGRKDAEAQGKLRWLEHGEQREYTTVMRVLENNAQISELAQRIGRLCPQKPVEFPAPSGDWS